MAKAMSESQKDLNEEIARIEREITANQHWTVRVFLGWKAPMIALVIGLIGLVSNIVKQHGGLTQFSTTAVNMVSCFCLLVFVYGLIGLANYDWSWGKENK